MQLHTRPRWAVLVCLFVWEIPALRWMRCPRGTQNAGKGTLIMRVRVLIMPLRVLVMLFRVLIMLLRVLVMLIRVLIMLLRVLMMRAKRSDEAGPAPVRA